MTHRILTFALTLLLIACQSKPAYEQLIDDYLQTNLKDPSSYENIEMDTPKLITPMSMYTEEANRRVKAGEITASEAFDAKRLEAVKQQFVTNGTNPYDTLAWEVSHRYRAKNSFGALEIEHVKYRFNKAQTEIISVTKSQ